MLESLGREVKEKLPAVMNEASQQILEAMPMWDQGWAWRAQGNRTAQALQEVRDRQSTPYKTRDGRPITVKSKSEWAAEGLSEHRQIVGKSSAGYHGGLETSHRGGDSYVKWSRAYKTSKEASQAIDKLRSAEKTQERKRGRR